MPRQHEFTCFLSLQTCGNKVLLATINLRGIFKTQIHAEVKLQKKASWEEKQILHIEKYKLLHFSRTINYAKF